MNSLGVCIVVIVKWLMWNNIFWKSYLKVNCYIYGYERYIDK